MTLRLLLIIALLFGQGCTLSEPPPLAQCLDEPVYQTTANFATVSDAALRLAERFGAERVLVVLDIDNTLLIMNQDLGSDQWFNWQFAKLFADDSQDRYFDNLPQLLDAQRLLYDISAMSPVEAEQPALLGALQARGLYTVLLTSRGPEMHSATLRELSRNGYPLNEQTLIANSPRPFYPDICGPSIPQNSFSQNSFSQNTKPQNCPASASGAVELISFNNGLYLTSGQHKGAMLKHLLQRADLLQPRRFDAIVFADDTLRHVQHLYRSFCDSGMALQLFHYTRAEPRVERFLQRDKAPIYQRWQQLLEAIQPLQ